MTRRMWVMRGGKLLECDLDYRPEPVNAPFVLTDEIKPVKCHADGKVYTSRRELSRAVEAAGCVSMGWNHEIKPVEADNRAEIEQELHKAYNDLRWGNVSPDELTAEERAICRENDSARRRNSRRPRGRARRAAKRK